jgi:hypothetical protein
MRLRGPGKYDDEATSVMQRHNAAGVILVVVNGDRGDGCSVQSTSLELMERLPELLDVLAAELRKDREAAPPAPH